MTQAARRPGGPSWALPPRPPDAWLHPGWSLLLAVALAAAALVPLAHPGVDGTGTELLRLALDVGATAGAAAAAGALLVTHVVRGDGALRWVAAGFGLAWALLLTRSLHLDGVGDDALTVAALSAPALYALTAPSAHRPWLSGLPLLGVGGLAALAVADAPAGWLAAAAVGALAAPVWWWRERRPLSVGAAAALAAAAALVLRPAPAPGSPTWQAGQALVLAATALPALLVGVAATYGYGRQSRRWHQLEREVLALRTGSPLLPNRSITPDDDGGLPSEAELQALIDADLVRIALQPVVRLADGDVVGQEALSRFGGRVPTDRWFKAASRYGHSGALERVTLRQTLRQLPRLAPDQFLAVNISPAALYDATVMDLLAAADLSRVVVEITEHEAVADYVTTRSALGRLRAAGARIAVDDTGAGFASLRHVLMLQPDIIKLDTSLTRGIERDERQQALVRAVTTFAGLVGAQVLAEGIEEEPQLDAVRGIGVDLGQGWHLGVPRFSEPDGLGRPA